MNYRHAFHAGNFADVHKHLVLIALIERLKRKPAPFFYLDTHAGRGWYDLQSAEAARTNEWQEGITRLRSHSPQSPDLSSYLEAIQRSDAAANTSRYPGSPILAMKLMREADRAVFIEKQLEEASFLEQSARGRRGVSIVHGDGYSALKTYLPPRENRGLVLIDPPYESDREFAEVARGLCLCVRRWPNGVFLAWYPLKATPEVQRFHATLKASGLRKLLMLELAVRPMNSPIGLNGSGLLIVNPPWQFDVEMTVSQQELQRVLAPEGEGFSRVEWLVPE